MRICLIILLMVFIFIGYFSVLLSVNAQSSNQPLSESSETSGTSKEQAISNNIIENSLKKIAVASKKTFLKIYNAFKDFIIKKGLKWLKEITFPGVEEYFQVKKSEVQGELRKEKEELKGEIKEYLSKASLMLWEWLKNSAKNSIK